MKIVVDWIGGDVSDCLPDTLGSISVAHPVDNILNKWQRGGLPMTQSFDAANRIVSMVQGATTTNYTYDKVGNMTLEAAGILQTGYVYDGQNRLTKLTNPDGTIITNTYAGEGYRRTTQQPGKAVSTMVWDGTDYLGQY